MAGSIVGLLLRRLRVSGGRVGRSIGELMGKVDLRDLRSFVWVEGNGLQGSRGNRCVVAPAVVAEDMEHYGGVDEGGEEEYSVP